jgi:hypothetical protein
MACRSWQSRRIIWTENFIMFSRAENDVLIDSIPLSEVKSVDRFQEALNTANHHAEEEEIPPNQNQDFPISNSKKLMAGFEKTDGSSPATAFEMLPGQWAGADTEMVARGPITKVMQIKTDRDGHNSGRTYYIRANESDDFGLMITRLSRLAKSARKRSENKSRFERNQLKVRRIYNSRLFQYFVAVLIFGVKLSFFSLTFQFPEFSPCSHQNFIANATEAQLNGTLQDLAGSQTHAAVVLMQVDYLFTAIFTCELLINLFAYWLTPFLTSGW